MGKNIKVIATVVPTWLQNNNNAYKLKLSVVLTPRIQHSGSLKQFEEMRRWYDYAQFFKSQAVLSIYSDVGALLPASLTIQRENIPTEPDVKAFWNAMFSDDTPVSRWLFSETPYQLTEAITQDRIREAFRQGINETIEQLLVTGSFGDTADPSLADGRSDERLLDLASFAEHLQQLKEKSPAEIMNNDAILRDHRYRPYLKALFDKMQAIYTSAQRQYRDTSLQLDMEEVEKRNFEQMHEFHKRLSGYSSHDHVLRQANMTLDYYCDDVALASCLDENIYLRMGNMDTMFENGGSDPNLFDFFMNEIDFVYPLTACRLPKLGIMEQSFRLIRDSLTLGSKLKVDERNGYIIRADKDYQFMVHGVDKTQLIARMETILKANFEAQQAGHSVEQRNTRDVIGHERSDLARQATEGTPSQEYVTSGLSLDITNLRKIVEAAIDDDPENPDTNATQTDILKKGEGIALLYRHHLTAGYRVDVAGMKTTDHNSLVKGSLCVKDEQYSSAVLDLIYSGRAGAAYEGWLAENTQGATSGKQYIDEELFRWNDENLVAARFQEQQETVEDQFVIRVLPRLESAVPLRFGWKYSFALRSVDIAGGGQAPVDENNLFPDVDLRSYLITEKGQPIEQFWTTPIFYQRVESVNSPIVYLGHRIYQKSHAAMAAPAESITANPPDDKDRKPDVLPDWLPEYWGEDLTTMVIRSTVTNHKLQPKGRTVRYLAPPRANLQFVTQHGQLDEFYAQLRSDFRPPLSRSQMKDLEALKNEFLDAADVEVERQFDKVASGGRISHMYDPLAAGYELIIDDVVLEQDWQTARPMIDTYYHYKYWLKVLQYKLELRSEAPPSGNFSYETGDNTTYFRLGAGTTKTVQIGCRLVSSLHGVLLKQCFLPSIPQVRRVAVQLVHAVQHPCLIEEEYDPGITYQLEVDMTTIVIDRLPSASAAAFSCLFARFPVHTADSYILHVQYFQLTCDPFNRKGYVLNAVSKIIRTDILPSLNNGRQTETNVRFDVIDHVFDNPTFRKAFYKIEAVSRFKKYYAANTTGGFSIYGRKKNGLYLDQSQVNQSDWDKAAYDLVTNNWELVKNAKSPEPPKVEKIVPVMHWEETKDAQTRRCDVLRIYLGEEWYSSGLEEKLVVFFVGATDAGGFNSGHILNPKPDVEISYDGVISQFGADPAAFDQPFNPQHGIDFGTYFKYDAKHVKHENMVDIRELQFEKPPLQEGISFMVSGVVCDVNFLPGPTGQKGKFYAEVLLDPEKMKSNYFPFIRLAIARYQQYSVNTACRFSKVITTDFVQLLPYRKLTVTTAEKKIQIETPAFRGAVKKGGSPVYNEVYLLPIESGMPSGLVSDGLLWELIEAKQVKPLGVVDKTVFSKVYSSNTGSYLLAEYEVYDEEAVNGQTLKKDEDPRNLYTRRLIFSAFVNL